MDWGRAKGRGNVNVDPSHSVVPGVEGGVSSLLNFKRRGGPNSVDDSRFVTADAGAERWGSGWVGGDDRFLETDFVKHFCEGS